MTTEASKHLMRIGAMVEFCPPRLGSDRRIYELLTRLPENIEVHFFVVPPTRALLGIIPFSSIPKKDNEVLLSKNIFVHYFSIPNLFRTVWKNHFIGYFLTFFYVMVKVLGATKRANTHIIVLNCPSAYTGLIGFVACKVLKRKIVTEFDDITADYVTELLSETWQQKESSHGNLIAVIHGAMMLIQNYIVKYADLVTALTTYTIKYAKDLGIREDINLIPDGVDTALFRPTKYSSERKHELKQKYGIDDKDRVAVYIGRMDKWAGVDLVLGCAKILRQSNIKFLLIGEGPQKSNGEMPNVIFTGRVNHESVPAYLAISDVVLVPMQQGPLGQSASPLKLFEGMAMMKPVIASNTQGICDVIKHDMNGLLLPPDETMWAKAIADILNDPKKASRIGKNARETVRKAFNWQVLVKRFEKLLYSTMNS